MSESTLASRIVSKLLESGATLARPDHLPLSEETGRRIAMALERLVETAGVRRVADPYFTEGFFPPPKA
jgi:hypothetical protein